MMGESMSRGIPRLAGAVVCAAAAATVLLVAASGAAAGTTSNPWLTDRFLNIAHQGGESEAPSNTMFAFKSAIRDRGADMLELDTQLTQDGVVVVSHDDTVSRITDGPQTRPASQIRDMPLSQVQSYDAGYWFHNGSYSHSDSGATYPYRGIRTGAKPPPPGYTANDFRIPTLQQVLNAFPHTPINIEIKMPKVPGSTLQPGQAFGDCDYSGTDPNTNLCDSIPGATPLADALAHLLNQAPYSSRTDLNVVSFAQQPLEEFHSLAPDVSLAPSEPALSDWALHNIPFTLPESVFQVPPRYNVSGHDIDAPAFLLNNKHAHELGYAVHVYTDGDQDETPQSYKHLIDLGVDGIMTSYPSRLAMYLCLNGIPRPDGSARCARQDPKLKIGVSPQKRAVTVGTTQRYTVKLKNTGAATARRTKVCVQAPPALLGARCKRVGFLAGRTSVTRIFDLTPSNRARNRQFTLRFTGSSTDAANQSASAQLTVRKARSG